MEGRSVKDDAMKRRCRPRGGRRDGPWNRFGVAGRYS